MKPIEPKHQLNALDAKILAKLTPDAKNEIKATLIDNFAKEHLVKDTETSLGKLIEFRSTKAQDGIVPVTIVNNYVSTYLDFMLGIKGDKSSVEHQGNLIAGSVNKTTASLMITTLRAEIHHVLEKALKERGIATPPIRSR